MMLPVVDVVIPVTCTNSVLTNMIIKNIVILLSGLHLVAITSMPALGKFLSFSRPSPMLKYPM